MNIWVHISFLISVFKSLDKYPREELLDHMVVLFLIFWGISILFSIAAAPIYIPTNSALGFQFTFPPTVHEGFISPHPHRHLLFVVFLIVAIWQVWSLWFWFTFPWWLVMFSTFSCTCWPFVCLLWKNVYSVSLPIFKIGFFFSFSFFFFFHCWVVWVLYTFSVSIHCQIYGFQIFSPIP